MGARFKRVHTDDRETVCFFSSPNRRRDSSSRSRREGREERTRHASVITSGQVAERASRETSPDGRSVAISEATGSVSAN